MEGNANKRNGEPFSYVQESDSVIHIIRTWRDVFSFWVNESTKDAVDDICSLTTRLSLHSVSLIFFFFFLKKKKKSSDGKGVRVPFHLGPHNMIHVNAIRCRHRQQVQKVSESCTSNDNRI